MSERTGQAVCDASALVASLLDAGLDGQWATETLRGAGLVAPSLLDFEASNIIRRLELAGTVSKGEAAQAHADLLDLEVDRWPYELLGPTVWKLRLNLSSYDASYVAVAELIGAPLVTLDRRIRRAPGVNCVVLTP